MGSSLELGTRDGGLGRPTVAEVCTGTMEGLGACSGEGGKVSMLAAATVSRRWIVLAHKQRGGSSEAAVGQCRVASGLAAR